MAENEGISGRGVSDIGHNRLLPCGDNTRHGGKEDRRICSDRGKETGRQTEARSNGVSSFNQGLRRFVRVGRLLRRRHANNRK